MSDPQTRWRFCVKCSVLFSDGFDSRGNCPSDGRQHAAPDLNTRIATAGRIPNGSLKEQK
jgi:hypothetical protein